MRPQNPNKLPAIAKQSKAASLAPEARATQAKATEAGIMTEASIPSEPSMKLTAFVTVNANRTDPANPAQIGRTKPIS